MKRFNINDRVSLRKEALCLSYIKKLIYNLSINLSEGKKGKVIGYSQTGKVAIQFDEIVFCHPEYEYEDDFINIKSNYSDFNNGCHGKGKKDYCLYIPESYLRLEKEYNENHTTDELLLLI